MLLQDLKGINLVASEETVGTIRITTEHEYMYGILEEGNLANCSGSITTHPRYKVLQDLEVTQVIAGEDHLHIVVQEPKLTPLEVAEYILESLHQGCGFCVKDYEQAQDVILYMLHK